MTTLTLNTRKIGSDDISWGVGSFNYEDYNGIIRTINQVNAGQIPVASNTVLTDYLLDITSVSTVADMITAVSDFGSTNGTLYLKRGTYTLSSDLTIPSNVQLWMEDGATIHVLTTKTLTVNGPIIAGRYQIFSWAGTGAIDISASNTNIVYPEWWGAVAEAIGGAYSEDNTAIFTKMVASTGSHQEIVLGLGGYKLASAWVMDRATGISIRGGGYRKSAIYIDIGGTGTGVKFGALTQLTGRVKLRDIAFIGPASSCTIGVEFILCDPDIDKSVNFVCGATSYIVQMMGIIGSKFDLLMSTQSEYTTGDGTSGSPLNITYPPSGTYVNWQFNNNRVGLFIGSCGTAANSYKWSNPVTISHSALNNTKNKIFGDIESFDDAPLTITNLATSDIDLYIEGTGTTAITEPVLLQNCQEITARLELNATTWTVLKGCRGVLLEQSSIYKLWIRQDCRGIILRNNAYTNDYNPCVDDAPDTQFQGYNHARFSDYQVVQTNTPVIKNLLSNVDLDDWTVPGTPDGYSGDGTMTEEGTIIHWGAKSAKIVTGGTGGYKYFKADVSADILRRMTGRLCTYSFWVYATGTLNASGAVRNNTSVTVPNYATGTGYKIGDAVLSAAGDCYFCVVAGTSDSSPPTWDTTYGAETIDNDITWVRMNASLGATVSWYLSSMAGTWHKVTWSFVVPWNATAVDTGFNFYDLASGAAATYYVADPSLVIGSLSPGGYLT